MDPADDVVGVLDEDDRVVGTATRRHPRQHLVDEIGSTLRHAPPLTARAEAAPLAGEAQRIGMTNATCAGQRASDQVWASP
jgi:hypothetical protein